MATYYNISTQQIDSCLPKQPVLNCARLSSQLQFSNQEVNDDNWNNQIQVSSSTIMGQWHNGMVYFTPPPAPIPQKSLTEAETIGFQTSQDQMSQNGKSPIGHWHNGMVYFSPPLTLSSSPESLESVSDQQSNDDVCDDHGCVYFEDGTYGPAPVSPKSLFDRPIEFHSDYIDGYFDCNFVYRPYSQSK
ncbi:unnamed protein product [Caenorhabditis bovis]|uniref:Uncharacterized protein n=1 Tax=Caenorhabditis bovis TaxID=2654633 RepID=A0A8S1ETW7_9PELO|nr:unnamed protein product [Caenorhabditis bovis]